MKYLRLIPVLLSLAVVTFAQDEPKDKGGEKKAPPAAADKDKEKEKDPVLSVTEHEITVGGKVLKYQATAGYLVLKSEKGEPRANIFFVAYTKLGEGDPAKRPLTFSFNGGPGSSSV